MMPDVFSPNAQLPEQDMLALVTVQELLVATGCHASSSRILMAVLSRKAYVLSLRSMGSADLVP